MTLKFFRPYTSLLQVIPHDDGLFCVFGSLATTGKAAPPYAASLAFADGHELWSDTNVLAYAAAVPISGKRIMTAVIDAPKKSVTSDLENQEITASGWDANAFRGAMFGRIQNAMARGSFDLETSADGPEPEPDTPAQNYTVRFRSLENGTETGHQSVSLKHAPQIEQIGRFCNGRWSRHPRLRGCQRTGVAIGVTRLGPARCRRGRCFCCRGG